MLAGTTNSQTWETLTTGTDYILFDISFAPGQNDVGYAGGMQTTYNAEGVVIKTIDGGDNWTEVLGGAGQDGIEAVCFTTATTGFVAGWNNYFAKTTDGGTTWTPMTVGSDNWVFKDIEFWDSNNGIAVSHTNSSGHVVYVTTDGGDNWTTATGLDQNLQDVAYATADILYAVGGDEKISKSTDGGNTWTQISSGIMTYLYFGVDFDGDFGVVGGEDGKRMSTTDGGATWSTSATGYENLYGVHVFNSDSAYIGGTDENIYKTLDSGSNWEWEEDGTGTSHIYKIKFTENNTGFLCASQGLIKRKEAPLNVAFSSDIEEVCAGSSVSFYDESIGATTWSWTFEGGTPATSAEQNPTIVYNTTGIFDVNLEISDGSNTISLNKPDMITVVELTAQADMPTGDQEMCAGENTDYTTNAVAQASSYLWEVLPVDAGTIEGSTTTATFTSAEDWGGDYTVKVRAINTCGNGPWSDELECTLNAAPLEFNLSEGGSYCEEGDGVEITLDGSETGVDYYLYFDGSTVSGPIAGTGDELSFGFFTDEGYYSSDGTNGICTTFMIGDAIISMDNLPQSAGTPDGPEEICSEETSDYTIEEVEGALSYVWTIMPEEAGTIIGDDLTGTVTWASNYEGEAEISAHGNNDCGTGGSEGALIVMVYTQPTPLIEGDDLVCQNADGEYSVAFSEYSTYEWTVDGGDITSGQGTNELTVYWTAAQGSTTYVDVTESKIENCQGIAETFEVTIDECVGVEELTEGNINVFPNPANSILNISLDNISSSKVEIKMFNAQGKIALIKEINNTDSESTTKLDVSNLPQGIYLLSIKSNGIEIARKKVIIIK